jgi:hypothetical protein
MEATHSEEPMAIGEALSSVRAAIDVVRSGAARRVSVHVITGERILPAARALARASGLDVQPIWWPDDDGCDLIISGQPAGA